MNRYPTNIEKETNNPLEHKEKQSGMKIISDLFYEMDESLDVGFCQNPIRLEGMEREKFLQAFSDFDIVQNISNNEINKSSFESFKKKLENLIEKYSHEPRNIDYFETILEYLRFLLETYEKNAGEKEARKLFLLGGTIKKMQSLHILEKLRDDYFEENEMLKKYKFNFRFIDKWRALESSKEWDKDKTKIKTIKKSHKMDVIMSLIENKNISDEDIIENYSWLIESQREIPANTMSAFIPRMIEGLESRGDKIKEKYLANFYKCSIAPREMPDNIERVRQTIKKETEARLINLVHFYRYILSKRWFPNGVKLKTPDGAGVLLDDIKDKINGVVSAAYNDMKLRKEPGSLSQASKLLEKNIEDLMKKLIQKIGDERQSNKIYEDLENYKESVLKQINAQNGQYIIDALCNGLLNIYPQWKKLTNIHAKKTIGRIIRGVIEGLAESLLEAKESVGMFMDYKKVIKLYKTFENEIEQWNNSFELTIGMYSRLRSFLINNLEIKEMEINESIIDKCFGKELDEEYQKRGATYQYLGNKIFQDYFRGNFEGCKRIYEGYLKERRENQQETLKRDIIEIAINNIVFHLLYEDKIQRNEEWFKISFQIIKEGFMESDGEKLIGNSYKNFKNIKEETIKDYIQKTIEMENNKIEGLNKILDQTAEEEREEPEIYELLSEYIAEEMNTHEEKAKHLIKNKNLKEYFLGLLGNGEYKSENYYYILTQIFIHEQNYEKARFYSIYLDKKQGKGIQDQIEKIKEKHLKEINNAIKIIAEIHFQDEKNTEALSSRYLIEETKSLVGYPTNTISNKLIIEAAREVFNKIRERMNAKKFPVTTHQEKTVNTGIEAFKKGDIYEKLGLMLINIITPYKDIMYQYGEREKIGIPDIKLQHNIVDVKLGNAEANIRETIEKYQYIIESILKNNSITGEKYEKARKLLIMTLSDNEEMRGNILKTYSDQVKFYGFDKILKLLEYTIQREQRQDIAGAISMRLKGFLDRKDDLIKQKSSTMDINKREKNMENVEQQIKEEKEKESQKKIKLIDEEERKRKNFIAQLKEFQNILLTEKKETAELQKIEYLIWDITKDYVLNRNHILQEALNQKRDFSWDKIFEKRGLLMRYISGKISYEEIKNHRLFNDMKEKIETQGMCLIKENGTYKYRPINKDEKFLNPFIVTDRAAISKAYEKREREREKEKEKEKEKEIENNEPKKQRKDFEEKEIDNEFQKRNSAKHIADTLESTLTRMENEHEEENKPRVVFHVNEIADIFKEMYEDIEGYVNQAQGESYKNKSSDQKLKMLLRANLLGNQRFQQYGSGFFSIHHEQRKAIYENKGANPERIQGIEKKIMLIDEFKKSQEKS